MSAGFTAKEALQVRTDIDKLKTHQSFLDHIYTQLKDQVSGREKKAEESLKNSLQTYRTEMDKLLHDLNGRISSFDGGQSFLAACRDLHGRVEQCWASIAVLDRERRKDYERAEMARKEIERNKQESNGAIEKVISKQVIFTHK